MKGKDLVADRVDGLKQKAYPGKPQTLPRQVRGGTSEANDAGNLELGDEKVSEVMPGSMPD